jgi:16S rRNA C1402 (ribose-2'-O) methylase RsmI
MDVHRTSAEAGRNLRELICEKEASVVFYHSPYLRTKQTLDTIMPFFNDKEVVACLEEPRISEQQIGNFQSVRDVLGECDSMRKYF